MSPLETFAVLAALALAAYFIASGLCIVFDETPALLAEWRAAASVRVLPMARLLRFRKGAKRDEGVARQQSNRNAMGAGTLPTTDRVRTASPLFLLAPPLLHGGVARVAAWVLLGVLVFAGWGVITLLVLERQAKRTQRAASGEEQ